MNDGSTINSGANGDPDAENAALRAEADKSLTNAYEAVADFMKDLARGE